MNDETEPAEEPPQKPASGAAWLEFAAVLGIIGILVLLLIPEVVNEGGRAVRLIFAGGFFLLAASIAAGIGFSKNWPWGR